VSRYCHPYITSNKAKEGIMNSSEKKTYAAVVFDGSREYPAFYGECDKFHTVEELAMSAIRNYKITTPRRSPCPISVKISVVEVKNNALMHRQHTVLKLTPPLSAMTEEEYGSECEEVLTDVPIEFHAVLRDMAYDRGHSSGREEVVSILDELVSKLSPAIKEYRKKVTDVATAVANESARAK